MDRYKINKNRCGDAMSSWLRLWHDMPTDPKFRTISKISRQPLATVIAMYIFMLVDAANATERGRTQATHEDIASALDLEIEQVHAIKEAMQGRLLKDDYLTGWEKRQPKREDNSAERSKTWRENRKEQQDSERTRTQPNAPERPDTDTDTDTDIKDICPDSKIESELPALISEKSKEATYRTEAKQIMDFLNEKAGKRLRYSEPHLKLIIARLKSGAKAIDCRRVIIAKVDEWLKSDNPEFANLQYATPDTLFNATKFEKYLGQMKEKFKEQYHDT